MTHQIHAVPTRTRLNDDLANALAFLTNALGVLVGVAAVILLFAAPALVIAVWRCAL